MITVYGAGAIGGTTGAALAAAGHDVLLVDSFIAHVDAINAGGIIVERDGVVDTIAEKCDVRAEGALGADDPRFLFGRDAGEDRCEGQRRKERGVV
jgi:ketopantoate reductase